MYMPIYVGSFIHSNVLVGYFKTSKCVNTMIIMMTLRTKYELSMVTWKCLSVGEQSIVSTFVDYQPVHYSCSVLAHIWGWKISLYFWKYRMMISYRDNVSINSNPNRQKICLGSIDLGWKSLFSFTLDGGSTAPNGNRLDSTWGLQIDPSRLIGVDSHVYAKGTLSSQ